MEKCSIGIIGGSGFYSLLDRPEKIQVDTRYGKPSGEITVGRIAGRNVAFLPRHGEKHTLAPHKVPYRANIDALRSLGVERIIASGAVGSLVKEYAPGDFVFFDQFANMTQGRPDTFFDEKKVVHVSMAEPYCQELRMIASKSSKDMGIKHNDKGTVVVINGPRFSTKAESRFYMGQGFQLINMTQYPEAALAREREICYLGIGIVTDYDAGLEGRSDIKHVTFDEVNRIFASRIGDLKELIPRIIEAIPNSRTNCQCGDALKGSSSSQ